MIAASSSRPNDGSWLDRTLAYYPSYKVTRFGDRKAFIARMAGETGQAENTVRRALAALSYLDERGVDLGSVGHRPAIMAIEAVARVGRIDVEREAELLRRLLAGEGTVLEFRRIAEKLAADHRSPKIGSLDRARLSDVLLDHLPGFETFPSFAIQISDRPLMPLAVVDCGHHRLAVFSVTTMTPILTEANAQRLIEGAVLRSVVTCTQTVVCSEVQLGELGKTHAEMKPLFKRTLTIEPFGVENDLTGSIAQDAFKTRYAQQKRILKDRSGLGA